MKFGHFETTFTLYLQKKELKEFQDFRRFITSLNPTTKCKILGTICDEMSHTCVLWSGMSYPCVIWDEMPYFYCVFWNRMSHTCYVIRYWKTHYAWWNWWWIVVPLRPLHTVETQQKSVVNAWVEEMVQKCNSTCRMNFRYNLCNPLCKIQVDAIRAYYKWFEKNYFPHDLSMIMSEIWIAWME